MYAAESQPAAKPVQPAMMHEVFHHRQLLIDAGGLENDAELAANSKRLVTQIVTQDSHFALLQRRQHVLKIAGAT